MLYSLIYNVNRSDKSQKVLEPEQVHPYLNAAALKRKTRDSKKLKDNKAGFDMMRAMFVDRGPNHGKAGKCR